MSRAVVPGQVREGTLLLLEVEGPGNRELHLSGKGVAGRILGSRVNLYLEAVMQSASKPTRRRFSAAPGYGE